MLSKKIHINNCIIYVEFRCGAYDDEVIIENVTVDENENIFDLLSDRLIRNIEIDILKDIDKITADYNDEMKADAMI